LEKRKAVERAAYWAKKKVELKVLKLFQLV
jgi:hypothetical protein